MNIYAIRGERVFGDVAPKSTNTTPSPRVRVIANMLMLCIAHMHARRQTSIHIHYTYTHIYSSSAQRPPSPPRPAHKNAALLCGSSSSRHRSIHTLQISSCSDFAVKCSLDWARRFYVRVLRTAPFATRGTHSSSIRGCD